MYDSFFGISGAFYLDLFEQPVKMSFPAPAKQKYLKFWDKKLGINFQI